VGVRRLSEFIYLDRLSAHQVGLKEIRNGVITPYPIIEFQDIVTFIVKYEIIHLFAKASQMFYQVS